MNLNRACNSSKNKRNKWVGLCYTLRGDFSVKVEIQALLEIVSLICFPLFIILMNYGLDKFFKKLITNFRTQVASICATD